MSGHNRSSLYERLQSPLVLHLAALTILVLAVLGLSIPLLTQPGFGFGVRQEVLGSKRSQIASLQAMIKPMRGTAADIDATRAGVDEFYSNRISTNYSQITNSLGATAIKSGIRLAQIQYSQGGPGLDLNEVSMEVGISGSYPQIMQFINGVERDQVFFIIRALSFNGQEGGTVNLKIRISTWLKAAGTLQNGMKPPAAVISAGPGSLTRSGGE